MQEQEPITVTTDELSTEVMTLAEAQAAKDAALMSALIDRRKRAKSPAKAIVADVAAAEDEADHPQPVAAPRIPLNRAQRRAQVKQYARILALTERQVPVVNPTIIPKSARRRRKNSRYAH